MDTITFLVGSYVDPRAVQLHRSLLESAVSKYIQAARATVDLSTNDMQLACPRVTIGQTTQLVQLAQELNRFLMSDMFKLVLGNESVVIVNFGRAYGASELVDAFNNLMTLLHG